jgi:hypothetical protein
MRSKFRVLVSCPDISEHAKAARIIEQLEDSIGDYWMLSRCDESELTYHYSFNIYVCS